MSNDDDLYGDLYGNDEGDFPGFDNADSQTKETTKPAATSTETATTTPAASLKPTTDTKPAPAPAAPAAVKEEPRPTPKKEEPLTNPIPTFTEDTGSSYNQNSNKYNTQYNTQGQGQGAGNDNRSFSGYGAGDSGLQPIERVTDGDVRPGAMRDEGKMFVGGLNWDTTDEGLRNYFSQFGKIDACTIMRDPAGRSRGFAFLTFEDPSAVNKVMVQEHFLDGKIIDPKRAIPRTEHQRTVKMFVGGLAPSVTTERMKEYFSQFGKVIDATVMVDRDSSRSKGFGFVTFDDQSGAERLFGMSGLQIDGKMIEVKMAQPRSGMAAERQQRGQGYGSGNANYSGGGMGAGTGSGGNTPFDPQALATLYQRMAQLAGGQGGMGWGMNGMGVGMMGNMGMGTGGMGGMGMMGSGMGGNMGGNMMGMAGGMGVAGNMSGGGGGGRGSAPRGPAAMRGGVPGVPTGPSGGGLGPARMGRGHQHNYHPYSR